MMHAKGSLAGRRGLGRKGIAAVEFAMCAPLLIILFLGTIELLMLYRTQAKLNVLAANFAQMVSLQTNSPVPTNTVGASPPGLTDLCKGASYGLQPFPPLGLAIAVASVTETAAATYEAWEVDMNSSCAAVSTQTIGTTGSTGAVTVATGSGTAANAMLQGVGDNIIIVRATLSYPGVFGLILTSAQNLKQTAVARWRYASSTNVSTTSSTTPSTLDFQCAGSNCVNYSCSSSASCTVLPP